VHSAIGGLGFMAKAAVMAAGVGYAIMNPAAAAAAIQGTANVAIPAMNAAEKVVQGSSDKMLNTFNIRDRMAREGVHPSEWVQYMQTAQATKGKTELERNGKFVVHDELRPFFPIAGSMDVELQPGDIEQKKKNAALFANYKPPNWPLGNMDNQLYFQNLVLQGVQWMSPLDSVPPVLPGGSLYTGTLDFGSQTFLPSDDLLLDYGIMNQIEFRLRTGAEMVRKLRCMQAGAARVKFMDSDTKYIHNPMAEGVNSSMEDMRSDMNPLSTPLHADLMVGGTRGLRPIMPECDAYTIIQQPGGGRSKPVDTGYTQGGLYNFFGMYPGVH
jgi:hypothetical protein